MEFLDAVLPIDQGRAFQPPLPSKFGSLAMLLAMRRASRRFFLCAKEPGNR